ncbi:TetR/AcrR family acrAB operon transcriptional repressor [Paraburkholderia bannensis]|uniref:TetR/AcrR family acrAB operon transcriptional repressor n=1 Tax=Paraburkholderia bannensis TaxID=765414 RepID=A0A7W9U1V0_9BURK|nr:MULTISPECIES: TetR family transcriptional regulator [Paraburkholderia]MBB3259924.1 TetR/AcrR family acrAB operon transcriptional repressor [Paraburkholderia sp. WP4_3_2]MBB6104766.1 TetR/AcrR family acrAB operon transcriptional repressor [Paraburkholderia bannensis]
MRRTREQSLALRKTLLDCAEQIFARKGFAQTTLDEIAAKAGVTRGAIYVHFRNKADVFEALFERPDLSLAPFDLPSRPASMRPMAWLTQELRGKLKRMLGNRSARRLYGIALADAESVRRNAALAKRMELAVANAETKIADVLGDAARGGEIDSALDTHASARFIYAALTGFFCRELSGGQPGADDTLVARVVDTVLCCVQLSTPDHLAPQAVRRVDCVDAAIQPALRG